MRLNFALQKHILKGKYVVGDVDLNTEEAFGVKKFDVIVGNPPYQDTEEETGERKQKSHNLYSKFIVKGYELLNNDGYLCIVCPASWMTPFGNTSGKSSKESFKRLFRENRLLYLNLNDIQGFDVGSTFTAFVMQKNIDNNSVTKVRGRFKKHAYTSNVKISSKHIWLPSILTEEALSILEKTSFADVVKFDVYNDNYFHPVVVNSSKGKKILRDKPSDDCKYEQFHTNVKSKWANIPHPNQSEYKVLFTKSGYFRPQLDTGFKGTTEAAFWIPVNSELQGKNVVKILNNKLYLFIVNVSKWSGFNMPEVVQSLPFVDPNINWTDNDLYKHFGLTDNEVALIEQFVNEKY
jgi:site-specific DNA-methyltransferase (adenine-specific)